MKNKLKLLLCLHKFYFDKGLALTTYIKYAVALIGISTLNVRLTLILGLIYAVCCYFIGMIWAKMRMADAETEIGNRFNPFVREMRRKIKKRKI